MALLDVVTALTQEITFVNEMVENLAKRSEERKAQLRKQFEAAMTEESLNFAAVTDELNALRHKLAALIEEPKMEEAP
jgi:polyhydroxyalkanoate synthesis regulator phasin